MANIEAILYVLAAALNLAAAAVELIARLV